MDGSFPFYNRLAPMPMGAVPIALNCPVTDVTDVSVRNGKVWIWFVLQGSTHLAIVRADDPDGACTYLRRVLLCDDAWVTLSGSGRLQLEGSYLEEILAEQGFMRPAA